MTRTEFSKYMNSTELITSIKLNGPVPEAQKLGSAALLRLATEEMHERMISFIMGMNKAYFEYVLSVPVLAGRKKYRISPRAAYGAVGGLALITGNSVRHLIPISRNEISTTAAGPTERYYFEGSSVILYQTPTQDGSLELTINLRPSDITELSNHGAIADFDLSLQTITLYSIPQSLSVGALCDFLKGSSGFEILGLDNKITAIDENTGVITFESALSADLEIGDYVSPTGTAPFPQIPVDLHSTLALMTASRVLGSLGQLDQKGALDGRIKENLQTFAGIMFPRAGGENQKIVSPLL